MCISSEFLVIFLFNDSKTTLVHASQKKRQISILLRKFRLFPFKYYSNPPFWRIQLKESLLGVFSAGKGDPSWCNQPLPHHQLQTPQTNES